MRIYLYFLVLVFTDRGEAKARTRVHSIEKCKASDNKWDKDNMLDVSWKTNRVTRQSMLVYGNITVKNKVGPVTMGFRTYLLKQDSSRDLVFKVSKLSCKKPMISQLLKTLKFVIDDDCYFMPSSIELSNGINVDEYSWILAKTASTPGKYVLEIEFASPQGYIACMEVICHILYLE